MEEKKISEKESLELISQMIQSTKQRIGIGSGNSFLYVGYFTAILGVIIHLLIILTSNHLWNFAWFLMLILWPISVYVEKKNKPAVITQIDVVMAKVWLGIGTVIGFKSFIMTLFMLIYVAMKLSDIPITFKINTFVMLPMTLLLLGTGFSIAGIIIKERTIRYLPLIGIGIATYMLISMDYQNYNLYFGLAFIPMMIIPGHLLNKIARKQC